MNFKNYQEKKNIAYGGCCRSDLASSFLKLIQDYPWCQNEEEKERKFRDFIQPENNICIHEQAMHQAKARVSLNLSFLLIFCSDSSFQEFSPKKIVRRYNLTTYVLEKNIIYYRELLSTITVLSTLFNNLLKSKDHK